MNGNAIIGTAGLILMALFVIIGNLLAPKYFDNQYKLWYLLLFTISMVFHMFYLYPAITELNLLWILNITSGLSLGCYAMLSEMIQLEIQPTKDSGKVNGTKSLIGNWSMAVALVAITIWWKVDHHGLFYVAGIPFGFAILFVVIMIIIKYKHQQN